ncbi:MAG TPA: response regulator [Thermoguttaceae bacterium]|nr:response regulator [Thermoguttaceae bacterium]
MLGRDGQNVSRETVGRPMEILLVEDDLEDAGLTIEALRESDVRCRVSLVRDGEEAVEFLHRRGRYGRAPRPDLILLDLNLPKKDGREVLAEIKADRRLRRKPVVVLTASTTHREILEEEHLHVEDYLLKPVDVGQFIHLVKSLRRYWLSDVILPS